MSVNELKTKAKHPTDAIFGVDTDGNCYHRPLSELVHLLVAGTTGCHAAGEPIMMADGSTKPVELINGGDLVMGDDGTHRLVLCPREGIGDMYEVTVDKVGSFTANGEHRLKLVNKYGKGKEVVMTVDEFLQLPPRTQADYRIPLLNKPIEYFSCNYTNQDRPIDPYFLGVLIGDGCMNSYHKHVNVTTADEEIVNEIYKQAEDHNLWVRIEEKSGGENKAKTYYFREKSNNPKFRQVKPSWFWEKLTELGLAGSFSDDKFVPDAYKFAPKEDRLQLLAGLLDTDGHLGVEHKYEFITKSKQLAEDVLFLVQSLGMWGKLSVTTKTIKKLNFSGDYYRLYISSANIRIPCRLPRKQNTFVAKVNPCKKKFSIKKIGENVKHYGFTCTFAEGGDVDQSSGDEHGYLLGNFVKSMNSG